MLSILKLKEKILLSKYLVLKTINKFILSFIIFFAIYIQICGEDSPGGGFQAGVIFASGLIMLTLTSNISYNKTDMIVLGAIGLMIYFLTGAVSLLYGKQFLDYNILSTSHITGQKIGIFVIELGVGIAVFSSILLIYILFDEE